MALIHLRYSVLVNLHSADIFPCISSDDVGADGDHHVSPTQPRGGATCSAPQRRTDSNRTTLPGCLPRPAGRQHLGNELIIGEGIGGLGLHGSR